MGYTFIRPAAAPRQPRRKHPAVYTMVFGCCPDDLGGILRTLHANASKQFVVWAVDVQTFAVAYHACGTAPADITNKLRSLGYALMAYEENASWTLDEGEVREFHSPTIQSGKRRLCACTTEICSEPNQVRDRLVVAARDELIAELLDDGYERYPNPGKPRLIVAT